MSLHAAPSPPSHLELAAWEWPDIGADSDLGELTAALPDLRNGDVVVITSKVVSKAEGMVSTADRPDVIRTDTYRVVARRGDFVVAETRHGLVLAAAGVDASNVAEGQVLSLPLDPDATARRIRDEVHRRTSRNIAVIITDTAGRPWREGQTDLAIGCAGIHPLVDMQGHLDTEGRLLQVTLPALVDEIAAAADLVKGKVSRRPVAVARGLADYVLPSGNHGPGAAALIRPTSHDLFGLGARDAVSAAVRRDNPGELSHFPEPIETDASAFADLATDDPDVRIDVTSGGHELGSHWGVDIDVRESAEPEVWLRAGRVAERAEILAAAYRLRPVAPAKSHSAVTGWHAVARLAWIVA